MRVLFVPLLDAVSTATIAALAGVLTGNRHSQTGPGRFTPRR